MDTSTTLKVVGGIATTILTFFGLKAAGDLSDSKDPLPERVTHEGMENLGYNVKEIQSLIGPYLVAFQMGVPLSLFDIARDAALGISILRVDSNEYKKELLAPDGTVHEVDLYWSMSAAGKAGRIEIFCTKGETNEDGVIVNYRFEFYIDGCRVKDEHFLVAYRELKGEIQ